MRLGIGELAEAGTVSASGRHLVFFFFLRSALGLRSLARFAIFLATMTAEDFLAGGPAESEAPCCVGEEEGPGVSTDSRARFHSKAFK